jgi:hypothetical protein
LAPWLAALGPVPVVGQSTGCLLAARWRRYPGVLVGAANGRSDPCRRGLPGAVPAGHRAGAGALGRQPTGPARPGAAVGRPHRPRAAGRQPRCRAPPQARRQPGRPHGQPDGLPPVHVGDAARVVPHLPGRTSAAGRNRGPRSAASTHRGTGNTVHSGTAPVRRVCQGWLEMNWSWVAAHGPFTRVDVALFDHGVRSRGLAPVDRWQALAAVGDPARCWDSERRGSGRTSRRWHGRRPTSGASPTDRPGRRCRSAPSPACEPEGPQPEEAARAAVSAAGLMGRARW